MQSPTQEGKEKGTSTRLVPLLYYLIDGDVGWIDGDGGDFLEVETEAEEVRTHTGDSPPVIRYAAHRGDSPHCAEETIVIATTATETMAEGIEGDTGDEGDHFRGRRKR